MSGWLDHAWWIARILSVTCFKVNLANSANNREETYVETYIETYVKTHIETYVKTHIETYV